MNESLELDASIIFKQDADQLTTVQNLDDGLERFGFTKDDKISRRELVNIYNQIRSAMEPEIFRLANSANYAEAKEMRQRFNLIRSQFDDLQLSKALNSRQEQQELFEKASAELARKINSEQEESVAELSANFATATSTHHLYQDIEKKNLEQTISKIHRPNVRYSKRLIELFKAEYGLNKLKEYDEAIKVRRMIDKLLPLEERKFNANFDASISMKRKKLEDNQSYEQARLEEKMKAIEWKEIRRRELELSRVEQRVKNNAKDMNHTHHLESKLKAEMSVKPSALWQHRQVTHSHYLLFLLFISKLFVFCLVEL